MNAECNNTEGSYNCTCEDGFHGNGTNCTGECYYLSTGHVQMAAKTLVAITCEMNFHCSNGINFVVSDVDECTNGIHGCDVNAECNNTKGSYNCTCKDDSMETAQTALVTILNYFMSVSTNIHSNNLYPCICPC